MSNDFYVLLEERNDPEDKSSVQDKFSVQKFEELLGRVLTDEERGLLEFLQKRRHSRAVDKRLEELKAITYSPAPP